MLSAPCRTALMPLTEHPLGNPALQPGMRADAVAATASLPRLVTIAKRPLAGGMRAICAISEFR